jgi:hypothetical protein
MFQLFCYSIYVHVKIINVNWNMELNLRNTCHHKGGMGRPWLMSHPVLEGKPNANHVRARISNSRTQQLHNMDIITQCSNSTKKGIIVDYIISLRHPHSLYK